MNMMIIILQPVHEPVTFQVVKDDDLWWWMMNVMTLMMIPWPLMNITLLPVHEPVTIPGCDRWWPLMMDDDPMPFIEYHDAHDDHHTPTRTFPVVTDDDLCWWMMNVLMTNDHGADPKKWTFDIFSDETSPVTTFTELFSAVCNKNTSIIGGERLEQCQCVVLSSTRGSQWAALSKKTVGVSQTIL